MDTGGDAERILRSLRRVTPGNGRLGRVLAIFGLLSVLGGIGFLVVSVTVPLDPEVVLVYRELAVGLAGYGLPAFLSGLVVSRRGEAWVEYASLLGVLACSFAVLLFVWAYPTRWNVTGGSGYVIAGPVSYGLGTMLCALGVGGAIGCSTPQDGADEFIWGDPPDS